MLHPTTTLLLLHLSVIFLLAFPSLSVPLASTDLHTLLRIRRLLEFPPPLSPLPSPSSFCSLPSSSSLSLSCTPSGRLSSLRIMASPPLPPLSPNFSLPSLLTTLSRLPSLTDLSLSSLGMWGALPPSLSHLSDLSHLDLSHNYINATLPLSLLRLTSLSSLDLSGNRLTGAIPPALLSLPSIRYLNLSSNSLTGNLDTNACSPSLTQVDLSMNLLFGNLSDCLSIANASWNCLDDRRFQHPPAYCGEEPLPVIPVVVGRSSTRSKVGIVIGGVCGAAVVLCVVVLVVVKRRRLMNRGVDADSSVLYSSDEKRKVEEERMGVLGTVPYRVFNEDEVEEMTCGFEEPDLVERSNRRECYRGWLQDGQAVTIRKLELKQKLSTATLRQFTDAISKLHHRHIVTVLGHSVIARDNSGYATIYLVFEHLSNGTLRSHLIDAKNRDRLKWPQRVAAVIGVARGIQFLHTCGIHGIDIKMENIVMDEAFTAKISNYNLPIPTGNKNMKGTIAISSNGLGGKGNLSNQNAVNGSKEDVYQFGLILVEIITGKTASSDGGLDVLKLQLQNILTESIIELHKWIDPNIIGTFMYDSLRTVTEVALSCLSRDHSVRPSIDDVLWHLQYSIQVQYACGSSGSLSVQSFRVPM